jgi:hypothetical protein
LRTLIKKTNWFAVKQQITGILIFTNGFQRICINGNVIKRFLLNGLNEIWEIIKKNMKQNFLNIVVYTRLILFSQRAKAQKIPAMPAEVEPYIQAIKFGNINSNKPEVNYFVVSKNVVKVSVTWRTVFLKN